MEVWDVQSHLQIGTAPIPLRDLSRGDNAHLVYESVVSDASATRVGKLQIAIVKVRKDSNSSHVPTTELEVSDERQSKRPDKITGHHDVDESVHPEDKRARRLLALQKHRLTKAPKAVYSEAANDLTEMLAENLAVREREKEALLAKVLSAEQPVKHSILCTPGRCNYFEVKVTNPYAEERVFEILFEPHDEELQLVTDADEWRVLRDAAGNREREERDMIFKKGDVFQLYLTRHEEVYVPFKLQHIVRQQSEDGRKIMPEKRTVQVSLQCAKTHSMVAKLQIEVITPSVGSSSPGGAGEVIDATHRFYAEEGKTFEAYVPISAACQSIRSTHDYVRAEVSSSPEDAHTTTAHIVLLDCKDISFLLHLYQDRHRLILLQTIRVVIQALPCIRSGFEGKVRIGKPTSIRIPLPSGSTPTALAAFSQRPDFLKPMYSSEETWSGCMEAICSAPGITNTVVNIVDPATNEKVCSYLLEISATMPRIKETYDVAVNAATGLKRKFQYMNPYDCPRMFIIEADHQELLRIEDTELHFEAKETKYVRFELLKSASRGTKHLFVMIKSEIPDLEGDTRLREEDTLEIIARYQ